jgi:ketosteroid isomerase-like protein
MAQENVEVVRKVFDAAARSDTAAIFDLYDPYIVWDASRTERGAITGKVIQGRESLLKWLREWYEPWGTVDDILEELIDAGQQRVVSIMMQRGRGRASGVEVENRLGGVWTIQDGKVIRVVWFPSGEDALEAVGLSEQDAHADS